MNNKELLKRFSGVIINEERFVRQCDVEYLLSDEINQCDIRTQAAIAAMQGIASNKTLTDLLIRSGVNHELLPEKIADVAVKYADALFAKLENTKER